MNREFEVISCGVARPPITVLAIAVESFDFLTARTFSVEIAFFPWHLFPTTIVPVSFSSSPIISYLVQVMPLALITPQSPPFLTPLQLPSAIQQVMFSYQLVR